MDQIDLDGVLADKVRTRLEKLNKRNANLRAAYCSGVYFALILALAYEEKGRPEVNLRLWSYLMASHEPQPTLSDWLLQIRWLSYDQIDIEPSLLPNIGLRYGLPGRYYDWGVADALAICVFVAPQYIRENYRPKDWSTKVSDWIGSQMEMVSAAMEASPE